MNPPCKYHQSVKTPNETARKFLKFLNLAEGVRNSPTFPVLDPVEERLLSQLAAVWHTGAKVTVLKAMKMAPFVSPSTVHRRLKAMRKIGMLVLIQDAADERIHYVEPTPKTHSYFAKLGQCLEKAVGA